eukprot:5390726-Prymnesium_polylepis.2
MTVSSGAGLLGPRDFSLPLAGVTGCRLNINIVSIFMFNLGLNLKLCPNPPRARPPSPSLPLVASGESASSSAWRSGTWPWRLAQVAARMLCDHPLFDGPVLTPIAGGKLWRRHHP